MVDRRRTGLTAACCGLLTLAGLTAHPAFAQADLAGKVVNIDVQNADFGTVVGLLERESGADVTVREGDHPFRPVTVHLVDAPLEKAMKRIAFSAHASVRRDTDGSYVFEPEAAPVDVPAPAQSAPAAPAGQAPTMEADPEARYAAGDLHWRSLVLQHAVPADILTLMHWDRDMVQAEPFRPLEMPRPTPNVASTQGNTIITPSYPGYPSVPLGNGSANGAGANYAQHRSADPASTEQANQFPGFNPGGGGGFNPGGGGGFNPGGGGFNPGGNNPFQQPQGFNPPGGANRPGGAAALPTGVARIFALQSNNSLLIEATPDGYNQVKQIVKILDIAPRQVEIKVEFVTASVADVDNLGINFDLVPYPGLEFGTQNGNSTISTAAAPTFLQYATGNLVAQLFQTLTRTRGKVVQAPMITTTNNVPADIEINTQIPFFTTSVVSTGGINNTNQQSTNANFLTLQTGLTITPRINSDDSVTMNLRPQITDTTGQASVGGIPPTVTQTLTTLRTVRSGDTMVLGGLVRKQETSSTIRIPILADLPYLGGLFRTRNKQVNDQELLIFVTPTIIGESNDSSTANANGGQSVTVTP